MRRRLCCSLSRAFAFETRQVQWTGEFLIAVAWLVLVLSFGAVWLLYFLIRRSGMARVVSLFYLTPPFTALMAWALFDERLAPLARRRHGGLRRRRRAGELAHRVNAARVPRQFPAREINRRRFGAFR